MPYLSRIPLAATYGTERIWRYIGNTEDFLRWNGFHLFSLIPILLFGLLCVFGNVRWAFYAAVAGHFITTILFYHNFGEPNFKSDDFLGCVFFPPLIAAASGLCGTIALVLELLKNRRVKSHLN